jgi:hypothetical protein
MAEPGAMEAGVVNVLLTIDPAASHAAGRYLTWDGEPLDDEETARCDAATPHELRAWALTSGPGRRGAGRRADLRRLATIVASAPGASAAAFSQAVPAYCAGQPAREVLAGQDGAGRPYPAAFRDTALPRLFRETVLDGLAGDLGAEALDILGRLEAGAPQGEPGQPGRSSQPGQPGRSS